MIGFIVAGVVMSTAPSSVEVTVYNQGFGLVKEVRSLELRKGRQRLPIEDVAAQIEATSVGYKALGDKDAFHLLEQNYEYDLISPLAILNKSVGQRVRFVRAIGNQRDVLEGVLISSPTAIISGDGHGQQTYNGMVIRTDDGRIVLNPTGEIEVAQVPAGLITRPTLMWEVEAAAAGRQPIELSYLTQGMSWAADYVLTLDGAGKGDLQGWVTLNNQSGKTYENAKLKLLAGDVSRVQEVAMTHAAPAAFDMVKREAAFAEESLFEYHLYTLGRPTTIADRQTKQVSLLEGQGIAVTKKLIVDALQGFHHYLPNEGEVGTGDIKPQVRVELMNSKENGLGMPLPMGKIKVYQRDREGSVQLLGEDRVGHTPRNERISLVVGRSFDVVASRRRTEFRRIGSNGMRETFEIEVRNRKETSETVHVIERHWGDWRIVAHSHNWTRLDANAVQFVLALKPDETVKVQYTVETKW
jgi:hypothetical protein